MAAHVTETGSELHLLFLYVGENVPLLAAGEDVGGVLSNNKVDSSDRLRPESVIGFQRNERSACPGICTHVAEEDSVPEPRPWFLQVGERFVFSVAREGVRVVLATRLGSTPNCP